MIPDHFLNFSFRKQTQVGPMHKKGHTVCNLEQIGRLFEESWWLVEAQESHSVVGSYTSKPRTSDTKARRVTRKSLVHDLLTESWLDSGIKAQWLPFLPDQIMATPEQQSFILEQMSSPLLLGSLSSRSTR